MTQSNKQSGVTISKSEKKAETNNIYSKTPIIRTTYFAKKRGLITRMVLIVNLHMAYIH